MIHASIRTTFIASLAVALIGGVLLVACQALGLVIAQQYLIAGPNGIFKTVLCVAAAVSAVAAYLLVQMNREPAERTENGARR